MTVYVESNFVLEIVLGQEQSDAAEAILERAERGDIALALPAFSMSEPFSTVAHRSRRLQQLRSQMAEQLRELARSKPHQEDVQFLTTTPELLASIDRREQDRLVSTVERIYTAAIVIPIDVTAYGEAMTLMARFKLSPQDATICAAILAHIRTGVFQGPHLFINRNWKDFEEPGVMAGLAALDCEFLRSFVDAQARLERPPHAPDIGA